MLKEHEATADGERFQDGRCEQIARPHTCLLFAFFKIVLDSLELGFDVRSPAVTRQLDFFKNPVESDENLLSTKSLKRLARFVFSVVSQEPDGCFGHEDHSDKQDKWKAAEDPSELVPRNKCSDDVRY